MADKKKIEVVIGGRAYNLAGMESPEYIEMVAKYLDSKLNELKASSSPNIVYDESFPIILALNIADDLFKEKENKSNTSTVITKENENSVVADLSKRLNDQTKDMTELKNQYSIKVNDYNILLDQFEAKSKEVDGLKTTIINLEDVIEKFERKTDMLNGDITELKGKVDEKSQYITDLNAKINSKNQELNTLSKKLNEKNVALSELNQKAAEKNIKLNNVNKERDDLAVKLKSANSNIKSLEGEIEKLKKENKDLTGEKESLRKDVASVKDQFDTFKSSLDINNENQLKAAFAKVKAENIELMRKIESLETKLADK